MANTSLKVRIRDSEIGRTEQIGKQAENAGLKVRTIIPELGLIYGEGKEELIRQLPQLQGVEIVEPEGGVQLPPLTEKVPQ